MSVEAIRTTLLKLASNMSGDKNTDWVTLDQLFDNNIVEIPKYRDSLYSACYEAATRANQESIEYPAPIAIYFEEGETLRECLGHGSVPRDIFTFQRMTN